MQQEIWRLFWAKTDRKMEDPAWTRPLWAHLLDVGHAAMLLWDGYVPVVFKRKLSEAIGLSMEETGRMLSFWIGLHDIGKAIPTFQGLHAESKDVLRDAGLSFDFHSRVHHGHASIAILHNWVRLGKRPELFEYIGAFVGFHHGKLYPEGNMWDKGWKQDARNPQALGDQAWQVEQLALLDRLEALWSSLYPVTNAPKVEFEEMPSWLVGFAGWATLADWLGSMGECYVRDAGGDLVKYAEASRDGAQRAMAKSGLSKIANIKEASFDHYFPNFIPNALQQFTIDTELHPTPTLTIIEAPTGEGKTEAAFYLTARQQSGGNGFYLAMPTQATSNGLFDRTISFLEHAHKGTANFRLAHGNAELHEGQMALYDGLSELEVQFDEDQRDSSGQVRTLEWFRSRKRALLAPYGLGTVDQVLLGVLYARHFFLRLFALSGKTVVFDEVHAYDLYMMQLFYGLLEWLRDLGTHVIILSATLPASFRDGFIRAWGGDPEPRTASEVTYPAVWSVADGACDLTGGFETRWTQQCQLRRNDADPVSIAGSVMKAAEQGACIGVICNTVARAQQVYKALAEMIGNQDLEVVLFHARFRFGDRQVLENRALKRFGKDRPDCVPAILIATQVAEQSLDLDFDVLFTDLAPIDLLLQRAGRLHRHSKKRPANFSRPTLHWHCPDASSGSLPDMSVIGIRTSTFSVYNAHIVQKTWFTIKARTSWTLPANYRMLVESVYDGVKVAPQTLTDEACKIWQAAVRVYEKSWFIAAQSAGWRRTPPPNNVWDLLGEQHNSSDDGDRLVLTRDGADSVEAILLYRGLNGSLFLDLACKVPAPLQVPEGRRDLTVPQVRQLLENSIRISYEKIAEALRSETSDLLWQAAAENTPSLAGRYPLILEQSEAAIAGYRLRYDRLYGLHIQKL